MNLNSDPRRWLPGATIAINQTVTLPTGMPAGFNRLNANVVIQ